MNDCSQNCRFNLQNWVKYSKMLLQRYRDNKSEFIARTQFFGKSEFVLSLIILFENKHSNFVYFRFLQKMFSKMLTDTLVLLLCTAATAGENDDVVHVAGLLGGSARLPCDTTLPTKENPVILVIWLKEPAPNPIYTYDLRTDGRGNHWYDSFNLGGRAFYNGENSSSFLAIENLQEKDRGRYRCRVDFDKAPAKIYKVALQVVVPSQPPVLVTGEGIQLEEIQYFEGSHLTVHCRVKGGVPPPQLFWFVNGKSVEGVPMNRPRSQQLHQGIPGLGSSAVDTPGVGLVSSYLDFGVLARNDLDTNITCSALNSNLSAPVQTTRRIQMKLLPQQVQILNTRATLSADTETSIRCSSWGSRPVAELTWWLGGELLHSNLSQVSGNEAYSNLTESVLRFKPTRSDSRKFLKCRAQNPEMPASEIEDSWNLDVNFKPLLDVTLGQTLDPRQIKEGDDVYFECLIVAKPPVYKISWDFNGRELKQNMRDGIIFGNQSLVLQGLEKGSSGNYSCRATNEEGVGVSKPIHLDVKFEANPAVDLMFRWTFNNTSETSDIQESRFTQIGPVSNLVYSPFHELDYGTILCWAGNQLGHQQLPCIFHIIPAGPPEPPQGCRINSSSTDSIQVPPPT
ncbi:titin [Eurytemora carolleeae]|uniref:titin n=1 Tax=Eurytemora carolleeae TaxID=1294199 RepID=UPI000C762918|nr:titin [Eurytemora carolleeae]|eukprot:XP_023324436.1 titin-like [Eurytemora affinis]